MNIRNLLIFEISPCSKSLTRLSDIPEIVCFITEFLGQPFQSDLYPFTHMNKGLWSRITWSKTQWSRNTEKHSDGFIADEQRRSSASGERGRWGASEERQWQHQHGLSHRRAGATRHTVPQTSYASQTTAGIGAELDIFRKVFQQLILVLFRNPQSVTMLKCSIGCEAVLTLSQTGCRNAVSEKLDCHRYN